MRSLNPNVYPKEGYFFQDKDGAKIFGQTWNGVIARVVAYRKRANYEPGNPAEEVVAQACARNPVLCVEDNGTNKEMLRRAPLKSRVLTWLNKLRGNKNVISYVDDALARERQRVCASCPSNTPLPGGCASCAAAVKELRKEVLGSRFSDQRMSACEILGEDVAVTTRIEITALDNGELPAACWRKRSL
jgi:hypothetical protein